MARFLGVIPAMIGLGGVLAGALLTAAWNLLLRRRDEKAVLREVARLGVIAFERARNSVSDRRIEARQGPGVMRRSHSLVLDVLEAHRPLLARHLESGDWTAVGRAMEAWRDHASYDLWHIDEAEWRKKEDAVLGLIGEAQS